MTIKKTIVIICAMQEELNSIINILNLKINSNISSTNNKKYFQYQTVNYQNMQIVFLLCGIGKVNAAIHTQHAICKYKPDLVINVGVAGGLSPSLTFGDVVVATDLVHHDFDTTAFNLPLGQILFMDTFAFHCEPQLIKQALSAPRTDYAIVSGRIITGDQFIDDPIKAAALQIEFNALACEMEGAAVAQACYLNHTPFIIIRALSDMAGQNGSAALHSFDELKYMAADRASNIVKHLLS